MEERLDYLEPLDFRSSKSWVGFLKTYRTRLSGILDGTYYVLSTVLNGTYAANLNQSQMFFKKNRPWARQTDKQTTSGLFLGSARFFSAHKKSSFFSSLPFSFTVCRAIACSSCLHEGLLLSSILQPLPKYERKANKLFTRHRNTGSLTELSLSFYINFAFEQLWAGFRISSPFSIRS